MLEPLRTYEYLALARKRIFDWARPLSAEQYTRQFPMGPGSVARTLTHILISEWYYIRRMLSQDVPPYDQWPIQDEKPPAFAELEAEWARQSARTRAALTEIRDWKAPLEYRITENGVTELITTSPSDIFTQLALHEVHHRAQVMNMLRHMGATIDDIDFNAIMYTRRKLAP